MPISDKRVSVPLDEVLMALYLVWENTAGGMDDEAFLELMPHLLPLWQANKGRAEWLWARLHHVAELDGPLPEPEAPIPKDELAADAGWRRCPYQGGGATCQCHSTCEWMQATARVLDDVKAAAVGGAPPGGTYVRGLHRTD